ncbi:BAG family molecular chaperone regulator 4 isoform X3 [Phalaenopsis equestris]|uniref:BAG family molecular chaperone regulator 4 isoform X3 n=1 Tax=Phalaenopsis equestris TaxID=78828 RepID=UPI0009E4E55A|nr:BAG family molecular chaperone regulator 4 isoform X3 [Phalaenopsis equestris]
MKGSNLKPNELENGNSQVAGWEMRPGGMLVQRREDGIQSTVPLIRIKISHDTNQHEVTVPAQSTFGELKNVVAKVTGLAPEEQRLLFRGKEKDDLDYLHMAGVKDMAKVVLLEDPACRERNREQIQRNQGIAKALETVSSVRHEVDKLLEKANALKLSVFRGTKVSDQEFVVLTELLMRELLKLDSVEAEGEARVQRKTVVHRIQQYVEMLDALKLAARNPDSFSNSSNGTSITTKWQTFDSGMGSLTPPVAKPFTKITDEWENFD